MLHPNAILFLKMAESASIHSLNEPSPLIGPSCGAVNTKGLAIAHQLPRHKANNIGDDALGNRLSSAKHPSDSSRDASLSSSMARTYKEIPAEGTPQRRTILTCPTIADCDAWQRPEEASTPVRDTDYHRHMKATSPSNPKTPNKDIRGGFKNTLRRIFSKRPTRDRISMPNSTVYHQHVRSVQRLEL